MRHQRTAVQVLLVLLFLALPFGHIARADEIVDEAQCRKLSESTIDLPRADGGYIRHTNAMWSCNGGTNDVIVYTYDKQYVTVFGGTAYGPTGPLAGNVGATWERREVWPNSTTVTWGYGWGPAGEIPNIGDYLLIECVGCGMAE